LKKIILLSAILFTVQRLAHGEEKEIKFARESLKLGAHTLKIEIARTDEELERGLMFRKTLGESEGMLFVYHSPMQLSFWMKNTFIPLSIGFFNNKKELIDIQEMEPMRSEMQQKIPTYQSHGLAQYALEVNPGWFKRNKVGLHTKFVELSAAKP
jgi:uncharacterized protein